MKQIRTQDAVGHVLCHDITRIVKGVTKDAAFRKGHIVRQEDIPALLSLGKEHLYIWECEAGMVHENDAAAFLYELCAGENILPSEVKEGKIELIAGCDGLFLADVGKLRQINSLGEIMVAARHGRFPVKRGDKLAGTRVIPLVIRQEKLELAKEICEGEPIFSLKPFAGKRVGVIVTGSEVSKGRIQDTFTPMLVEKLSEYGSEIAMHAVLDDDPEAIARSILNMISEGMELVLCTGGMSVDPDDRTPLAIKSTGARIISYGAPVLPGAMFLLARHEGGAPVMGLPGCVMYAKRTIFDLVLPLIMADIEVAPEDLAALGHGGLCLGCRECVFPNCGFGKGI